MSSNPKPSSLTSTRSRSSDLFEPSTEERRVMPELSLDLENRIRHYVYHHRTPRMRPRTVRRMISRKFGNEVRAEVAAFRQRLADEQQALSSPVPPADTPSPDQPTT